MECHEPVFPFGSKELLHNIYSVPAVGRVHIQNSADEFLCLTDGAF